MGDPDIPDSGGPVLNDDETEEALRNLAGAATTEATDT